MTECGLRAYLATALTSLTTEERSEVFACSDVVDSVCRRFGISLYQPKDHTDPITHAGVGSREVYLTDRERVATSDLVVALCTHPSHGVGAENEIAASAGVPVLHVVKTGVRLSKMLTGSLGHIATVVYAGPPELEQQLTAELENLKPQLVARRGKNLRRDGDALPRRLKDLRERSGISVENLAVATGMPAAELTLLETQDERIALPTVDKIRTI